METIGLMQDSQTLGLTANWLNVTHTGGAGGGYNGGYGGGGTTDGNSISNCFGQAYLSNNYYPYWTYPVYVSSPSRPIKLTLSEVERLRRAAKADAKLKEILSKFTSQIEITVDFE